MDLSRDQFNWLFGLLVALVMPLVVAYFWSGLLVVVQVLAIEFCFVAMGGMLLGGSQWFRQQNEKLKPPHPRDIASLN